LHEYLHLINPFNLIADCREFTVFSNSSDPHQMAPIAALRSGSVLFKNVKRMFRIHFSEHYVKNPQIQNLGWFKVQYWNGLLFH